LRLCGEWYESARFRFDGGGSACEGAPVATAPVDIVGERVDEVDGGVVSGSLEGIANGTRAEWLECFFRDGERESGGAGEQLAPALVALGTSPCCASAAGTANETMR